MPVSLNPFKKSQPAEPTQADFVTALVDLQEGRKSSSKPARKLQETISSYIDGQLAEGKAIGPGAFTTGFKHIIRAETNESLMPVVSSLKSQPQVVRELIDQALAHAQDPNLVPKCNVFTMDDAINGFPPSIGHNLQQLGMPLIGKDGHHNAVFMLQASHSKMAGLLEQLMESHESHTALVKNDKSDWIRAAWTSSLMQLEKADLLRALDGHADSAMAARIVGMSERLRATRKPPLRDDGTLAYELENSAVPGGQKTYPHCFEKDMLHVTQSLLGKEKDYFGKPIYPPEGEVLGSHVISLINAFGAKAAIHGDGRGNGIEPTKNILIGMPDVEQVVEGLLRDDEDGHAEAMYKLCMNCPIVVRMADGKYALQMPKAAPPAAAAEPPAGEAATPGTASPGVHVDPGQIPPHPPAPDVDRPNAHQRADGDHAATKAADQPASASTGQTGDADPASSAEQMASHDIAPDPDLPSPQGTPAQGQTASTSANVQRPAPASHGPGEQNGPAHSRTNSAMNNLKPTARLPNVPRAGGQQPGDGAAHDPGIQQIGSTLANLADHIHDAEQSMYMGQRV